MKGNEIILPDFKIVEHSLIKALREGKHIELHLATDDIPIELQSLTQQTPCAIIGGTLETFKGHVTIKTASQLQQEKEQQQKLYLDDIKVDIQDVRCTKHFNNLEEHQKHYTAKLITHFEKNKKIAIIQGKPGCGKSHLAGKLPHSYHLPAASATTSATDIMADDKYKQWVTKGEQAVLVIDEYNMANEGTYNFLLQKDLYSDTGEIIKRTDNHKILFLGNYSTTTGRNEHANITDLAGSIIDMQPLSLNTVISSLENKVRGDAQNSLITDTEQQDLIKNHQNAIKAYNTEPTTAPAVSNRSLQTYLELRKQGTAHQAALEFVYNNQIEISKLESTIKNFLDYTQKNSTGNRMLRIIGEAGIGKNHNLKAALEAYKRANPNIKIVQHTLGAAMDIDGFKKAVDAAAIDKNTILVLDEISAAPSFVLEYMNTALAKDGSQLKVVATDNPASYRGREQLSDALRNRSIEKHITEITQAEDFLEVFAHKQYTEQMQQLIRFHFHLLQENDLALSLKASTMPKICY